MGLSGEGTRVMGRDALGDGAQGRAWGVCCSSPCPLSVSYTLCMLCVHEELKSYLQRDSSVPLTVPLLNPQSLALKGTGESRRH